ncbi:hypothetical protein D9757_011886 [Collybiopsis confluens]|uniref:Haloacid dehalogenase n=1 Tax=Collybiopsis confluens TaxID=2823264 RepID=A0A8H5G8D0_9AGAR|nr:hypothetical protein D9757_012897 [Collybiopsis confluens]KAF5366631.1 hypothetical protein D9757_011886 [Collybiopsis confluens]
MSKSSLDGVEALIFDVFGTAVDWRGSVIKELEALGKKCSLSESSDDWAEFASEWRTGYIHNTRRIAGGGIGSGNVDIMHREILEQMLSSSKWSHVGKVLDDDTRAHLNLVWHRLNGWPDTVEGLHELKKKTIIATLSNGNVRLLVDMAKHAGLPWDVVFSGELFNSYKPNPATYQGALKHLSLSETPHKAAMVAAHIFDLRAAAKVGLRTVYVPRPQEEWDIADLRAEGIEIKSKAEGGDVDAVVKDFHELANLL